MGLTFLTGYVLGQHGRQSARLATAAGGSPDGLSHDVRELGGRLDRLVLAIDAMWSLLEERGFTAEDLRARMDLIDAEDGTIDGRRTPLPGTCRRCGARVAAGLAACQFCGSDTPENAADPFDAI